jgi:hypothetical protein
VDLKDAKVADQKIGDQTHEDRKDVVPKDVVQKGGRKDESAIPTGAMIAAAKAPSFAASAAVGAGLVRASTAAADQDAGPVFVRHSDRQARAALAEGPAVLQEVAISTGGSPSWSAK